MLKRWNSLLLGALRHVPSIVSPCFVRVFVRYRSDLSASAVWCAHDRYCRGTQARSSAGGRTEDNRTNQKLLKFPLEQTYPNTGRAAASKQFL